MQDMAALQGTRGEIALAAEIRAKKFAHVARRRSSPDFIGDERQIDLALEKLAAISDAGWWIERTIRDGGVAQRYQGRIGARQ